MKKQCEKDMYSNLYYSVFIESKQKFYNVKS